MFMVVWASFCELDHVYPTANMYRPFTTKRRRKLKSLSRSPYSLLQTISSIPLLFAA